MQNKEINITVYTENNTSMIVRIISMFSRRRIHVETMNLVACEPGGRYCFTIAVVEEEEVVTKLLQQIEKQVGVFKTSFEVLAPIHIHQPLVV